MTLTATEIHDRLEQLDNEQSNNFVLINEVTQSDVQAWLDLIDISKLESEADSQITRTVITDLQADARISDDNLCVCDVIESHNDNPDDYDSAYLIGTDRTIVQYKKRGVAGNKPITENEVESEMKDHVSDMVERAVNSELLKRAKTEFGA